MWRQNVNTTRPNIGARFALCQTFITPGAQEALEISGETPILFLRRHVSADWGELSEEDVQENELSLREGFRVLSAYRTAKDKRYGSLPKPIVAPQRFCCPRSINEKRKTQRECLAFALHPRIKDQLRKS
jgi:hypothetical protein